MGNPTYYETIVKSDIWQKWTKHCEETFAFDIHESIECGLLSEKHWNAFIEWVKNQDPYEGKPNPREMLTPEAFEKAGMKANEEQRKIFYKEKNEVTTVPSINKEEVITDPYLTQREECKQNGGHEVVKGHNVCCNDDNVHVNHPVQPKTQVEKWREEIDENFKAIYAHNCAVSICDAKGTDNCKERAKKIDELYSLISQDHEKNKRHLHKFFGGEFEDDKPKNGKTTKDIAKKYGIDLTLTRWDKFLFWYWDMRWKLWGRYFDEVTLLDKIKKLLCH